MLRPPREQKTHAHSHSSAYSTVVEQKHSNMHCWDVTLPERGKKCRRQNICPPNPELCRKLKNLYLPLLAVLHERRLRCTKNQYFAQASWRFDMRGRAWQDHHSVRMFFMQTHNLCSLKLFESPLKMYIQIEIQSIKITLIGHCCGNSGNFIFLHFQSQTLLSTVSRRQIHLHITMPESRQNKVLVREITSWTLNRLLQQRFSRIHMS